ncbi:GNAT family N-acetyltransferase [Heyndrickxia acidicola]|uniref:GNAT family N-acetyltransferase n=1 Tax=Heyndrickxia acidicola TaxID=209389 RepID=A0ABU6MG59_9BACI|nr:GNAT family N-acetyltransferase [Heyndrickxia acidicola]MED1203016.1 GNAT family N-acetyltransferase [Heyndrickxia acidicola]
MSEIEVRRPVLADKEDLYQFFSKVIRDTFAREGLSKMKEDIKNEIETKKSYLESDFKSNGKDRFFWLANDYKKNKVIGCIEYGPASELILACTNGELKGWFEIGTVFVDPDYQRQGIGSLLFQIMQLTLQSRGIQSFCLDSGYSNAQYVWKKKLGEPEYLLRDYWGKGNSHMIWRRHTNESAVVFAQMKAGGI